MLPSSLCVARVPKSYRKAPKGMTKLALAVSLGLSLTFMGGCSALSGSGMTGLFGGQSNQAEENTLRLDEIQREERERLTRGKSERPSLKSLGLMPEGRDIVTDELSNEADDQSALSNDGVNPSAFKPTPVEIPRLSLEQKRDEYAALLPLIKDEKQRKQVQFRLADINMLLAEQALERGDTPSEFNSDQSSAEAITQLDSSAGSSVFDTAIAAYLKILNENQVQVPDQQTQTLSDEQQALNRKLMDTHYQLARALDLAGKKSQSVDLAKAFIASFSPEYFDISPQHIEMYFRIGEYYFNRQQYAQASQYYQKVVAQRPYSADASQIVSNANGADFYGISAYMLGWSEFKQDKYDSALVAFNTMLAHTLLKPEQVPSGSDSLSIDQSLAPSIVASKRASANRIASQTIDELELSKGEMRLVKDSLRIMALTFSYQGNAQAIAAFFEAQGSQAYEHLVYEELAQQYLDDDRYQDSANALIAFSTRYPSHPRAVEFYIRHIDAYILGDFPAKVLLAKQSFVESYSIGNGVVSSLQTPIGQDAAPYLRTYLQELAQTEHSIAQGIESILQARATHSSSSSAPNSAMDQSTDNSAASNFSKAFASNNLSQSQRNTLSTASDTDLASLRVEAYRQAIDYYENFIRSFSDDPSVAERRFYLAEAYLALEEYASAIDAFETYAYLDSPNPMAVEAAYAALLAYEEVAYENVANEQAFLPQSEATNDKRDNEQSLQFALRAQASQIRFVETFAKDRRAPNIALRLMQNLFAVKDYSQAKQWATWLMTVAPSMHTPEPNRQRSARLVMAHSDFELQNYAQAETHYRALLSDVRQNPVSYSQTQGMPNEAALTDRLAASLYKQAESLLASVDLSPQALSARAQSQAQSQTILVSASARVPVEQAIGFFQQILTDAATSSFALAAQYDSATYYALLEQWPQAIQTYKAFATSYPDHPLAQNIDAQLLYAYQQTENWPEAAEIYFNQYLTFKDASEQLEMSDAKEKAREALYTAATLFDKAKMRDKALSSFRTYAHSYPEPMDLANEARYRMSEFYVESNEPSKRRFWLNKLMQAQLAMTSNSPASAGTPRSRYLAAMSAMVFAKDADYVFRNIKLTLPIAQSLAKKQDALNKAIEAYDLVMSFAVAQYSTEANYQLANLYMQLADDLMASERPDDLSELELSQYDILLEEQAYPFEETAISLHENNIARTQSGVFDRYVQQSFVALASTMPARYNKPEIRSEISADEL
uniref:tetratricopeptide repeat protein n=1 Tax=Ningiella ruwaisensis TaxID=2364274 RepID=UPI0010A06037|nr:tetratricopeptide repeat protein [Ningiella ruwaisensis]